MPTGKIQYQPTILASGKNKRAIVRRHSHDLFIEATRFLPTISGKHLKTLRRLIEQYLQNPYYWTARGNSSASEEALDELLKLCYALSTKELDESKPHYINPIHITNALGRMESDFVIKTKSEGENWCILKVDLKVIQEDLENLRKAGINISGSAWGPHISVIRDEHVDPLLWETAGPNEGTVIPFEIGPLRHNKRGYYWYDVKSKELEEIRIKLNLPPRPTPPFHLTIGKVQ